MLLLDLLSMIDNLRALVCWNCYAVMVMTWWGFGTELLWWQLAIWRWRSDTELCLHLQAIRSWSDSFIITILSCICEHLCLLWQLLLLLANTVLISTLATCRWCWFVRELWRGWCCIGVYIFLTRLSFTVLRWGCDRERRNARRGHRHFRRLLDECLHHIIVTRQLSFAFCRIAWRRWAIYAR